MEEKQEILEVERNGEWVKVKSILEIKKGDKFKIYQVPDEKDVGNKFVYHALSDGFVDENGEHIKSSIERIDPV